MTKFNVGDKVVPISKTVDWNTLNRVKDHLDKSGTWNRALSNEQTFLYVNRIDKFRNLYVCSNECGGGGDYFHESDLTPYKTKPTKNQRITALENEVAELKLIVHELRDGRKTMRDVMNEVLSEPSTTNTVEDIIEFEGQQYRKVDRVAREGDVIIVKRTSAPKWVTIGKSYKTFMSGDGSLDFKDDMNQTVCVYDGLKTKHTKEDIDVYELIEEGLNPQISIVDETIEPLTPNQQRAAIIEKAKKFVEEKGKGFDFSINQNKRIIAFNIYTEKAGFAKCNPSDVFNEHIGKAIALGRALGLDVSEFEQAVQPTEFAVGQVVEANYEDPVWAPFTISELNNKYNEGLELWDSTDGCFISADKAKIINDTKTNYEEG